jgi:membrane protein involved in colicin uptake
MTALDLLSQLREKGVEVKTSGDDRLVIDAPKGTLTEDLRSALSAHKAELLQILKAEQTSNGASAPANTAASELPSPAMPEPVSAAVKVAPPVGSSAQAPPEVKASSAAVPAVGGAAEEVAQLQIELMRLRTEEQGRRAEVEAARLASENALRTEQERWRQTEEEAARHRASQEKLRIEVEARARTEEEHKRQIAEAELNRAEEELKRMRAMEEARRAEIDAQMLAARQTHEAELDGLRKVEAEHARRRADEERHYLETEARKKAQEDELRRRAEMGLRAVEEEIGRVQAREDARLKAADEAQRLASDAARRRAEEEARRKAEVEAQRRAETEARLRAEIEAQMRAEAAARRLAEEETLRQAEEQARRRAEEEAQRLAAEQARRLAEAEAQRQASEEARRQAEAAARLRAEEEARRQAEMQARLQAEEEVRLRAEAEIQQRAELEARIRAEVEAKLRAEEAERGEAEATRRRAEHERIVAEETARNATPDPADLESELSESYQQPPILAETANVTDLAEWFEMGAEDREPVRAIEPAAPLTLADDQFGTMQDDAGGEFAAVSVPESDPLPPAVGSPGSTPAARLAAVRNLPQLGGEEAFHQISAAFDDPSSEVRAAAARSLFELQDDRAAAFTRALRDASPERRRKIGAAIASSGLANDAIRNLTGETRDKTYDAFSLLFLMSKAGETQPLMRAIEDHSNMEVRLAVVKLLALCGQPDILPAFRRMAVRGSLPPEIRSAVMEAIYQITSQSPAEFPPA